MQRTEYEEYIVQFPQNQHLSAADYQGTPVEYSPTLNCPNYYIKTLFVMLLHLTPPKMYTIFSHLK